MKNLRKQMYEKPLKNIDFCRAAPGGAQSSKLSLKSATVETTKIKLCKGGGREPRERRETGGEERGREIKWSEL